MNNLSRSSAVQQRKIPAKRAFTGLAGSPLSKIRKLIVEKSDHTLRVPKTPDRTKPTVFEPWFDQFRQKHGRIDLDCSFQEYAFDPHLGHGAKPAGTENVPSHAGALRSEPSLAPLQDLGDDPDRSSDHEPSSPLQDLGIRPDGGSERGSSFSTGLLEGDRQMKRRRPGKKTWWIFDAQLFREFIKSKYDAESPYEAEKAAYVLYRYYYQNRRDDDLQSADDEDWTARSWFANVRKVKQYRQYIVKQGAERFKDQKPASTWHGRRAIWRGYRCNKPDCDQCKRNEVSQDYSGRSLANTGT